MTSDDDTQCGLVPLHAVMCVVTICVGQHWLWLQSINPEVCIVNHSHKLSYAWAAQCNTWLLINLMLKGVPFPSLPFPSLPFPSLPFPSLPFPSLPVT